MKLACDLETFRVPPGQPVHLKKWPTDIHKLYRSKRHYDQLLDEYRREISDLQSLLYAHDRYALLLIFQGMDASGKDGTIRQVMSGINPQGCQVFSFKQPSSEELDHDFLWRAHQRMPERGRIGIFNRSYYEEVLVVRVRPELLQAQRLPEECLHPRRIWKQRFRDIVNLETYLHRNGTRIVKFFLHLSPEEQRQRLLARLEDPRKNWKFTPHDLEARRRWDDYQHAYAECLGATSTSLAPWYIVPADNKRNAHLIVAQAVLEALQALPLAYPALGDSERQAIQEARRQLMDA